MTIKDMEKFLQNQKEEDLLDMQEAVNKVVTLLPITYVKETRLDIVKQLIDGVVEDVVVHGA